MGQNQRCFDVKLVVTKQEYNPVVWMSTTTEPPYMTEETPAVTEARNIQSPGRDPVARLSYAAAATIATTVSVMVIMAVLLGVAIGLRRCRHSDPTASLSMSASGDSLRHVYEDVDNLAMTTNALYAFSLYNQNENFYSFKSQ
ncbi:uncharacterized protein LOC105018838 isoform X2 [Esox lucius]|nr:uncharacterized protein LOC105018838 isoform X2 [Esox lucius]